MSRSVAFCRAWLPLSPHTHLPSHPLRIPSTWEFSFFLLQRLKNISSLLLSPSHNGTKRPLQALHGKHSPRASKAISRASSRGYEGEIYHWSRWECWEYVFFFSITWLIVWKILCVLKGSQEWDEERFGWQADWFLIGIEDVKAMCERNRPDVLVCLYSPSLQRYLIFGVYTVVIL